MPLVYSLGVPFRAFLRNTGLEVEVDENKTIPSVALEAEYKDSPRDKLHDIVNNVPQLGDLKLKVLTSFSVHLFLTCKHAAFPLNSEHSIRTPEVVHT